jgi:hypothetical protein
MMCSRRLLGGLLFFGALGASPAWADAVYGSKLDCDNMFNSKGTQFKPDAAQQAQMSDCRACVGYQSKWQATASGSKCIDSRGRTVLWKLAQTPQGWPAPTQLTIMSCVKGGKLAKLSGQSASCEAPPPPPAKPK